MTKRQRRAAAPAETEPSRTEAEALYERVSAVLAAHPSSTAACVIALGGALIEVTKKAPGLVRRQVAEAILLSDITAVVSLLVPKLEKEPAPTNSSVSILKAHQQPVVPMPRLHRGRRRT